MKKIYRKQIIFVIVAALVVLAGVIAFFIVSKMQKNKYVEITLPCAMSDGRFTLAKLPKDYFKDVYISDDEYLQYELFDTMLPVNEEDFINNIVCKSPYFLKEYKTYDEQGEYFRWLLFDQNEYYLLDKNNENVFQLYRLYLSDRSYVDNKMLFSFPEETLVSNTGASEFTWKDFSESYGGIVLNDFSDICEFYERLDSSLCKIDYDNQTILVKGIQEATKTVSNDYLLKITADEEGFKAERLYQNTAY